MNLVDVSEIDGDWEQEKRNQTLLIFFWLSWTNPML